MDGSARAQGSGVKILFVSLIGEETRIAIRLGFKAFNNEVEYEVVLLELQAARAVGATRIHLRSDSQLVVSQIQGTFAIKEGRMVEYLEAYRRLEAQFREVQIQQIPREENGQADELARLASSLTEWASRDPLYIEATTTTLTAPEEEEVVVANQSLGKLTKGEESRVPNWRSELEVYFKEGTLPTDPKVASAFVRAQYFLLVDGVLFKRSYVRPLLRCLGSEEVEFVLREIHERCCGNHLGGRALARKATLVGYF